MLRKHLHLPPSTGGKFKSYMVVDVKLNGRERAQRALSYAALCSSYT